MCFIYEDQYNGTCWDFMFFTDYPEEDSEYSLKNFLSYTYGVQIVDHFKFNNLVFEMFKKMHEEGIIKPGE